jgi:hypothetical protein
MDCGSEILDEAAAATLELLIADLRDITAALPGGE